jgi:hypothetical protein
LLVQNVNDGFERWTAGRRRISGVERHPVGLDLRGQFSLYPNQILKLTLMVSGSEHRELGICQQHSGSVLSVHHIALFAA